MPAPSTSAVQWSRLHPLTPLLRGGRYLLALLVVGTQQGVREPRLLLVVLGVAAPLFVLLGYLSWRSTRYRLAGDELQVDSGVVQRRNRRVPLARLQSVDVVRPLVARLLGLAELRLEVAGGGETEAPLSYLTEQDAHQLRGQLLARSAGAPDEGGEEPPEAVLVQVPTRALVTSVLLSVPAVLTAALGAAGVVLVAAEPSAFPVLLASAGPPLLGTGGFVVRRLLNEYGFTVAESPDGLRLRHGLLDTRAQTIPAGRVQSVRVLEPLLWRRRGWVRVEVDVAGYGPGDQAPTGALLPVAPREFAHALAARVLGAPLPVASEPAPRRARWRAPLGWRRLRVGLDDRHLVATSGVLTTTTDVVPLAKVQSLRRVQGPWQRRLRLASLTADTAGRRLPGATARHRDDAEAAALLAELTDRVRLARRR